MIEKVLTGISDVLIKGLSELNSINSILFCVFLILLIIAGFVIRYIYKNMRADSQEHAVQLNKNFESLIQVHKDNAHVLEKLATNVEHNNKLTENLSNLIINKLL